MRGLGRGGSERSSSTSASGTRARSAAATSRGGNQSAVHSARRPTSQVPARTASGRPVSGVAPAKFGSAVVEESEHAGDREAEDHLMAVQQRAAHVGGIREERP